MPTYQYRCTACGDDLEAHQSFSDDPLTDCAACGEAGSLRKQFGSVGVVFKGSGFYRTDSRRDSGGAKADTAATKPAEKKSESTSATKTETKKADKKPAAASST